MSLSSSVLYPTLSFFGSVVHALPFTSSPIVCVSQIVDCGMDSWHRVAETGLLCSCLKHRSHGPGLMTASAVTACVKSAQGSSVSWQHPTGLLIPWDESHLCPDVFSCLLWPYCSFYSTQEQHGCLTTLHAYVLILVHLLPAVAVLSRPSLASISRPSPLFPVTCSYLNERPPSVSLLVCPFYSVCTRGGHAVPIKQNPQTTRMRHKLAAYQSISWRLLVELLLEMFDMAH